MNDHIMLTQRCIVIYVFAGTVVCTGRNGPRNEKMVSEGRHFPEVSAQTCSLTPSAVE